MTFREEAVRAAGAMLEHPKEGGFFVVVRDPGIHTGEGEVTLYPAAKGGDEHASFELHGLSREQTVRVLRVLSMGKLADSYLERAIAEGATYE
jgi:hypothetical protein